MNNYQAFLNTLNIYHKYLTEIAQKFNLIHILDLLNILQEKINTNKLSVVVIGEFNRGKTTFINALLGQEILPQDVLPTTATINRIIYGNFPQAKICFNDGFEKYISLEKLIHFVTKLTPEDEIVAKSVKECTVYYPVNYCQDNVEIIDTPGLNDDENMTNVTLSFLNHADLVIMIISGQSPFGETEAQFFQEKLLSQGFAQLLFVVNQIDRFKKPGDVQKVLTSIQQRIKDTVQEYAENNNIAVKIPPIFAISAYQGLAAKKTGDWQLLASSGFQYFEDNLKQIIWEKRGILGLQSMAKMIIFIANSITHILRSQQEELNQDCANFQGLKDKVNHLIEILRQEQTLMINFIDDIINSFSNQSIYIQIQLLSECKKIADQVITEKMSLAEYKANPAEFQSKLAGYISNSLVQRIDIFTDNLQQETNLALTQIIEKIDIYSQIFNTQIKSITTELRILGLQESVVNKSMVMSELSQQICTKLKEIQPNKLSLSLFSPAQKFIFPDDPSGGGTATGAVIGGLLFGPIGAGIGAAIGGSMGAENRAKTFAERYQPQVIKVVEDEIQKSNINQMVDDYMQEIFTSTQIKNPLIQVVNNLLETTENTLAEWSGKNEVILLNKHAEFEQIQNDLQKILDNGKKLDQQLDNYT